MDSAIVASAYNSGEDTTPLPTPRAARPSQHGPLFDKAPQTGTGETLLQVMQRQEQVFGPEEPDPYSTMTRMQIIDKISDFRVILEGKIDAIRNEIHTESVMNQELDIIRKDIARVSRDIDKIRYSLNAAIGKCTARIELAEGRHLSLLQRFERFLQYHEASTTLFANAYAAHVQQETETRFYHSPSSRVWLDRETYPNRSVSPPSTIPVPYPLLAGDPPLAVPLSRATHTADFVPQSGTKKSAARFSMPLSSASGSATLTSIPPRAAAHPMEVDRSPEAQASIPATPLPPPPRRIFGSA